jgi:hypothetical protein
VDVWSSDTIRVMGINSSILRYPQREGKTGDCACRQHNRLRVGLHVAVRVRKLIGDGLDKGCLDKG